MTIVHHPDPGLVGVRRAVADGDSLILGRGPRSCLPGAFQDGGVSREHARLERRGKGMTLIDLGSRNGTTLNGEPIGEASVELGDILGVGDVLLLLEEAVVGNEPPQHPVLLGVSNAMSELLDNIDLVARRDTSVMILGETGVGKELVARELHARSGRRGKLVALNCGGTNETLIASELFGHVRGAFTGADRDRKGLIETARGGTLFLDELVDASPELQVSLLRLLETGDYRPVGSDREQRADVRIIAAAQPDIEQQVAEGAFRRDLWTRLARWVIRIPPLRARRADIPLLAQHFAARFGDNQDLELTPECAVALMRHDWHGNVRELAAIIERLVVASRGASVLDLTPWLEEELRALALPHRDADEVSAPEARRPSAPRRKEPLTRDEIETALKRVRGNVQAAAEALGVGRRTLYRHFKAHDLDPDSYR